MFPRRPILFTRFTTAQNSPNRAGGFIISSPCQYSTSSSPTASSIASSFLSRYQSGSPQTRTQVLDANQLRLLSLTLNRPTLYPGKPDLSNVVPSAGTPLPPGYHLIYFTPAFLEGKLGIDGTDASFNPDEPFTRRMWAGGKVRWPRSEDGKLNHLRVGQEVKETTKLLSAEPKIVKKTGEEMIVVGVEKTLENEYGVAVIDQRNWVFRKALSFPSSPETQAFSPAPPIAASKQSVALQEESAPSSSTATIHRRNFTRNAVTLFRFSALTFNAHKIHYSLPWARDVEGHKSIVVHGPLNLISILDFWRDLRHKDESESTISVPESISYRATHPLYAEDEYQIVLEDGGSQSSVNIYGPGGVVAMKADIEER